MNEALAQAGAVVTAKLVRIVQGAPIFTVEKVYKGEVRTGDELEL